MVYYIVPVPEADLLRRSVGREMMTDLAWRHTHGMAMDARLRVLLLLLAAYRHAHPREEVPNTSKVVDMLCGALAITEAAASNVLQEAIDLELVATTLEGAYDGEGRAYWLGKRGLERLAAVYALLPRIDAVIAAQMREPENPTAGADLVPAAVYYNAIHDPAFLKASAGTDAAEGARAPMDGRSTDLWSAITGDRRPEGA